MRILIVNTFYYPNMEGGAEQSVKLLAEGLSARGHQVAVYCADARDKRAVDEQIDGVMVYRRTTGRFDLYRYTYQKDKVGRWEKISQKLICYHNPSAIRDFRKILRCFCPEIVHTNTLYGIPWVLWRYAKQSGAAVIHTIRDTGIVSPVQYGHKVSPLVVQAHQSYIKWLSRYVDAVTAPSQYTLDTSLRYGAFRSAAIKERVWNSVLVDPQQLEAMIQKRRERPSGSIRFLYAGRLIPLKGIRQMIEAFKRLKAPDLELRICGGGELLAFIKEEAEKDSRIRYLGKLTEEELADQYRECDVLLIPSVWPEPFGRVFIEGNQYGMPAIAGDRGGLPEIWAVTHGGELCDCEDIEALSAAMERFLDRDYALSFLGSIKENIQVFAIQAQIDSFERIYRSLRPGRLG